MNTYIFEVELTEEEDGRWSAVVPSLSGCNAWGHSKDEALAAIYETTKAYLETLVADGREIPITKKEIKIPIHSPAVAVTI